VKANHHHRSPTYVKTFQMSTWSNARQHQQMRWANCTGRHYNLLPRTDLR